MSRKDNCLNNSVMESFFGTLKEECVGEIVYSSHDEASLEIFTYIEIYYNRIRRHSTLGCMSPLHYEQMEDLPNVTFDVVRSPQLSPLETLRKRHCWQTSQACIA